jgi:hypothetical protein
MLRSHHLASTRGIRALGVRRILMLAGFAAVVLAAFSCDQGESPDNNTVVPRDVCGHVDNAGGLNLVTIHGDSLAREFEGQFDPSPSWANEIVVRQDGIEHGIHAVFLDEQGKEIPLAEDCQIMHLGWSIGDGSLIRITQDPGWRWIFNVEGIRPGSTTLSLSLVHLNHSHFTSLAVPITVVP